MTRNWGLFAAVLCAALLLSACARAEDVQAAAEPTSTTGSPTETSPTEPSPTEPSLTDGTLTDSTPTESSPTETETTPTEPKVRVAAKPEIGNCYATRKRDFDAHRDGSEPVKCKEPHTAETFAIFNVGSYPDSSVTNSVWRRCQPKFESFVGASSTVSKVGMTVIMPSLDQVEQGHKWARCDAIERAHFNGPSGIERTGTLAGKLSGGVPDRFRGCAAHIPKTSRAVTFVRCDQNHRAELIPESISLGGPNADYPGTNNAQATSQDFCENVFQNYVPETLNYFYYYPTRASWDGGSHHTVCWAIDRSGNGLPPI